MHDKSFKWVWAGASVQGTSHIATGIPKQDSAAFAEYRTGVNSVAVAVVCDGAGSAAHSEVGSRLACQCAQSLIGRQLASNASVGTINRALAEAWISEIGNALLQKAQDLGKQIKDLATTITIVIAGDDATVVIMVGDSPCVVHDGKAWLAPIWPMRGEYANQTYFITQMPIPVWDFAKIDNRIEKFSVFTDGIDKLVLKEKSREVFQPFFDGLFDELGSSQSNGRDRTCSTNLGSFFDSDRVNALTDDDKTLIIARRSGGVPGG